jgi:predicted Zn finger-like uncharacterized protein
MNLACPECSTVYRIDPARVAATGVATRCRTCSTGFRVEAATTSYPAGVVITPERVDLPAGAGAEQPDAGDGASAGVSAPPERPVFGPQDPNVRAKRLARALVSDIKVYNPDKWGESREQDTLRRDFRHEILKSWEEYLEQVGEPMAKQTPYFRDALNDILAEGQRIF